MGTANTREREREGGREREREKDIVNDDLLWLLVSK